MTRTIVIQTDTKGAKAFDKAMKAFKTTKDIADLYKGKLTKEQYDYVVNPFGNKEPNE